MDNLTTKTSQRPVAKKSPSLLQELGGEVALNAISGAFYSNVLNDKRLAHFLANSNTETIRGQQRKFFAAAISNYNQYRESALLQEHRSLVREHSLNHCHFDAISEVLVSTIQQFGYPTELNKRIVVRVNALRAVLLETSL